MIVRASSLPRLLYLADVPVECSFHGSALIYRLLQDYPTEKLLILEPTAWETQRQRRLPNVQYVPFRIGEPRLLNSRLGRVYGSFVFPLGVGRARKVAQLAKRFQPEAILTVGHGYSWLTAAALAAREGIPLHLILHDDCVANLKVLPLLRRWGEKRFAHCYRQARSRLCVSPGMQEIYRAHYGVSGTVFYPLRAKETPAANILPKSRIIEDRELVFAYAGTVNSEGYARALRTLAEILTRFRCRLLLYGPLTESRAKSLDLCKPNITLKGPVSSDKLVSALRESADVLFVPMSFAREDRSSMEMGFPSKLTEYTAAALPLLIFGPPYCSAVRWARDNAGVAEVVDVQNDAVLESAVERLARDCSYRSHLAVSSLAVGNLLFSYDRAIDQFVDSLCRN